MLERSPEDDVLLMDGLVVAPELRGQGLGSRLLEAVCAEARDRGCRTVALDVVDSNSGARALYLREGFKTVRTDSAGPLRHVFGIASTDRMTRPL